MKAAVAIALSGVIAVFAACGSTTTNTSASDGGPQSGTSGGTSGTSGTSGGTSGTSGTSGSGDGGFGDAGFGGGFDFVFTGGGADSTAHTMRVAPVDGSFCMSAGATIKTCSFAGAVTVSATDCSYIMDVSFVGAITAGTTFPVVSAIPTAEGKGLVSFMQICAGATSSWRGTGGTITLDVVSPPPQGLPSGTMTFSVNAATMAPDPNNRGSATSMFSISGRAPNISYTAP